MNNGFQNGYQQGYPQQGRGYAQGFFNANANANGALQDMFGQFKSNYTQPFMGGNQVQMPQNGFAWVLDENEARGVPVAPGNTAILWAKEKQEFYIKSVDGQGVPYFEACEWQYKQPVQQAPQNAEYVDRAEFERTISEVRMALEELKTPKSKKKTEIETEVTDNG